MTIRYLFAILAAPLMFAAYADAATVLFEGRTTTIERTLEDPTDLWVTPEDLTRANGFELKPEGLCLAEICIPVRENDTELSVTRDGQQWINATELARRLNQAYAFDADARVWSFAPVPTIQAATLHSAKAPDFALTDREGNLIRLSDFRGKKVFVHTWASW